MAQMNSVSVRGFTWSNNSCFFASALQVLRSSVMIKFLERVSEDNVHDEKCFVCIMTTVFRAMGQESSTPISFFCPPLDESVLLKVAPTMLKSGIDQMEDVYICAVKIVEEMYKDLLEHHKTFHTQWVEAFTCVRIGVTNQYNFAIVEVVVNGK